MSFTDLASFSSPTLIDQVLTPRAPSCKAFSFSSSTKWRYQRGFLSELFSKVSEILSTKKAPSKEKKEITRLFALQF